MNQGLSKNERLKSRKQISILFSKNQHVFSYPFKYIFTPIDPIDHAKVKLLISVSKRTFKHAVDRNRMKRLIREAYRKNKFIIYDELQPTNTQLLLGVIFVGKELMEYSEIEKSMIKGLKKLKESFTKDDLI